MLQMWIGLLLLLLPAVVFLLTIPVSRRLQPALCRWYRVLGGVVFFAGSGVAVYFAGYSGDQGGISALFFNWPFLQHNSVKGSGLIN